MTNRDLEGELAGPISPTRAQSLVESGLIDIAAEIADLAGSLTTSAMHVVEASLSERGDGRPLRDFNILRQAVFVGIAHRMIEIIGHKTKYGSQPSQLSLLYRQGLGNPERVITEIDCNVIF